MRTLSIAFPAYPSNHSLLLPRNRHRATYHNGAYQQGDGQQRPYQQQGYPPQPQYCQDAPQPGPPGRSHAGHPQAQSATGSFQGGTYNITHRDTNAVLNIDLQQGGAVRSKPGAMIHMAGTIELSGKVKFSMKKLFTGGEMSESTYSGRGRVALGSTLFGDIITIHVDPRQQRMIGKDAFLACTSTVKDTKAQGLGKAMFSGEDLFGYRVGGEGIMWLTSFEAVDRLDLQSGEQHIVDNGHLVAWSCDYKIEKAVPVPCRR